MSFAKRVHAEGRRCCPFRLPPSAFPSLIIPHLRPFRHDPISSRKILISNSLKPSLNECWREDFLWVSPRMSHAILPLNDFSYVVRLMSFNTFHSEIPSPPQTKVESSPVTPATPIEAFVESAVQSRRPPSKARRYANLIKQALNVYTNDNRGFYWEYSRESGLTICHNGCDVIKCEQSHRKIKSAYFLLLLHGKKINALKAALELNGGQIPDCGELSPEGSTVEVRQCPEGWPWPQNLSARFPAIPSAAHGSGIA